MRQLLAARAHDSRATLAIDVFCYQARKWIGALAAALGGLDTLVFSGGIGEHAPVIRAQICDGLGHLGIELDRNRNDDNEAVIGGGRCDVRIVKTDEEAVIARHTQEVLSVN
jgi:acetate kinase